MPWNFLDDRFLDVKVRWVSKLTNPPDPVQIIPVVFTREDLELFGGTSIFREPRLLVEPQSETLRDLMFYYSELSRNFFFEMQRRQVRAVIFNGLYPQGRFEQDQELIANMRDRRVYWSAPLAEIKNNLRPASMLMSKRVQFGFSDFPVDRDGIFRRFLPEQSRVKHVLAEFAKNAGYLAPAGGILGFRDRRHYEIKCSLTDILKNKSGYCGDITHKILVVGFDIPFQETMTPLGPLSPLLQTVYALDVMMNDRWVKEVPKVWRLGVGLAVALVMAYLALFYRTAVSFWIGFGLLVSGVVAAVGLQKFLDMHWALGEAFAMGVGSFVAFVSYRTAIQENLRWVANKQAEHLQQVDTLKNNFISLVSHELKTPLSTIVALSERLLRSEGLGMTDKSAVQGILQANAELHDHIHNMLSFANVEAKNIGIVKVSVDVNQVIADVLRSVEVLAADKGVTFEQSLAPLFPVPGDPQLLYKVVSILIENAVKYSPSGSWVKIATEESALGVEVVVTDSGPGIPQDYGERVFQKFQRGPRSPDQAPVKGTGLGLYLARYFVQLHGGTLELDKTYHPGAQFRMVLPL